VGVLFQKMHERKPWMPQEHLRASLPHDLSHRLAPRRLVAMDRAPVAGWLGGPIRTAIEALMGVGQKIPARRTDADRAVVMVGAVDPCHGADRPLLADDRARLTGGISGWGHPSLVRLSWRKGQALSGEQALVAAPIPAAPKKPRK
jgi:hypothetical protein